MEFSSHWPVPGAEWFGSGTSQTGNGRMKKREGELTSDVIHNTIRFIKFGWGQ